jgi:hypothetical protein
MRKLYFNISEMIGHQPAHTMGSKPVIKMAMAQLFIVPPIHENFQSRCAKHAVRSAGATGTRPCRSRRIKGPGR